MIPALAKRMLGRGTRRDELREGDFWALRDVSLDIHENEEQAIASFAETTSA